MTLAWLSLEQVSRVYLTLQKASEHFQQLDSLLQVTSSTLTSQHKHLSLLSGKLSLASHFHPVVLSTASWCHDLTLYLSSTAQEVSLHHQVGF